jgi:chaperonin GroES
MADSNIITPSKKIVLLQPVKLETVGGGVLEVASTGSEKDRPQVGKVLAIGSGKMPVTMKVGDIVAYGRYADTRFLIKGQEYVFVRFDDLLGIIN